MTHTTRAKTDGTRALWKNLRASVSKRCWLWAGHVAKNGYGYITVRGRTKPAHRAVYELLVGPIPLGVELDHLCKTPSCVNPIHLDPVTQRENNRRSRSPAAINARKTTCIRGHPLTGDNVSIVPRPNGKQDRRCKACHALRARKHRTE